MFARSIRQISAASLRGRGAGGIFQRASCRHFAVAPSLIATSDDRRGWNMTAISGLAFLVASTGISTAYCEENTPSAVARENLEEVTAMHSLDTLPVYESDFVAQHNGEDGTRIWMTYGGIVYDVTDFIPNHPGGSEQIMKAAGGVSAVSCMFGRSVFAYLYSHTITFIFLLQRPLNRIGTCIDSTLRPIFP
jgi:hypothetical protein